MGSSLAVRVSRVLAATCVGSVFLAATSAFANTISADFVTIQASNTAGTSTLTVATTDATYDPVAQQYSWSTSGMTLVDDGDGVTPVATLNPSDITIGAAFNVITLNFDVDAGMTDTVFTITTATVSFPTMAAPLAGVSGAMNVVDQDPNFGGGVVAIGQIADGANPSKAFLAQYNGTVPAGTTFYTGVESVTNNPGELSGSSGAFGNPNNGGGGLAPVGEPVSDISMQFGFLLSAKDNATGNAVYGIVPEPASALMLVLAGALVWWRRR